MASSRTEPWILQLSEGPVAQQKQADEERAAGAEEWRASILAPPCFCPHLAAAVGSARVSRSGAWVAVALPVPVRSDVRSRAGEGGARPVPPPPRVRLSRPSHRCVCCSLLVRGGARGRQACEGRGARVCIARVSILGVRSCRVACAGARLQWALWLTVAKSWAHAAPAPPHSGCSTTSHGRNFAATGHRPCATSRARGNTPKLVAAAHLPWPEAIRAQCEPGMCCWPRP